MKGSILYIDEPQIRLINLIDTWLMTESAKTSGMSLEVIEAGRVFLSEILTKGWYRSDSPEQELLSELRNEWIKNGGKYIS
jgi:hypothetical protein